MQAILLWITTSSCTRLASSSCLTVVWSLLINVSWLDDSLTLKTHKYPFIQTSDLYTGQFLHHFKSSDLSSLLILHLLRDYSKTILGERRLLGGGASKFVIHPSGGSRFCQYIEGQGWPYFANRKISSDNIMS